MIWQYSPKSLPYPYCRLIIPLIYLSTQTFSVRLTPILCKETISVRDGVRMDSARLGRQIPAGFSRKCLEKRERMRKHDGKVRRKERCRSELFYEQLREASTFTSLWLDVRRASAAVGDERATGDNVRSPSTRLYLPEVNFLLRKVLSPSVSRPLGTSLSSSSLSSCREPPSFLPFSSLFPGGELSLTFSRYFHRLSV